MRIGYNTNSMVIIMSSSVFYAIKSEIVQSMLAIPDPVGMNIMPNDGLSEEDVN